MLRRVLKTVLIVILFMIFQIRVNAKASLSISASSKSVTVGSSIVVTIKGTDIEGSFNIKSSDSSVLSGGATNTWIEEGKSTTYIFKAKKAGSATITVSTVDVSDFGDNPGAYNAKKSVTITVKDPVKYSSNNYLKSLNIEGVDFDFSKDKTSYSINLPKGVEKIKITGALEDSKAKVTGLGEKDVTEGDNYFEIKVTAENGSTRIYKINATLEEANPIDIKINDIEYRVVKKANIVDVPDIYKEQKIKINDIEVPAWTNEKNKLTLLGIKDKDGNISLAIYNNGAYELYKELAIGNLKLLELEFPQDKIKSNYEKTQITYDDQIIEAYKTEENKNLYFIYAMNIETGIKNIYQYDEEEKTIQRYFEHNDFDKDIMKDIIYKTLIIALCSILSFIIVTIKVGMKNKS